MSLTQNTSPQPGITVSTAIAAGVANGCTSGHCSDPTNHAEGIVLPAALAAGDAAR